MIPAGFYLGDCMEYMRTMPDKCVELAITDPPYGIGVKDSNPIANKSGDKNHDYITGKSEAWDAQRRRCRCWISLPLPSSK